MSNSTAGNTADTLTTLDVAIEKAPLDSALYYRRAWLLFEADRFEDACHDLDMAVTLDPDDHRSWKMRGDVLLELGQNHKAIVAFDRACSLSETAEAAVYFYSRALARKAVGDTNMALGDVQRCVDMGYRGADALRLLGELLADRGSLEQALELFDEVLANDPTNHDTLNSRGNASTRMCDYASAISDFSLAIDLAPSIALYWRNRGIARAEQGDLQGAVQDCSSAIALNPRSAHTFNDRGLARTELGEVTEALSDYSAAIEFASASDRPNYLFNRGNQYFFLQLYDSAIDDYAACLKANPRHWQALTNLALVHLDTGSGEAAGIIQLALDAADASGKAQIRLVANDIVN